MCSDEVGKYKNLIEIQKSRGVPGLGDYFRNLPEAKLAFLAQCHKLDLLSEIEAKAHDEMLKILREKTK